MITSMLTAKMRKTYLQTETCKPFNRIRQTRNDNRLNKLTIFVNDFSRFIVFKTNPRGELTYFSEVCSHGHLSKHIVGIEEI